jgi:hypothetical protein
MIIENLENSDPNVGKLSSCNNSQTLQILEKIGGEKGANEFSFNDGNM